MFRSSHLFRPKAETIVAKQTIDSLISNRHQIDEHTWGISIVRKKNVEHSFLIIEGLKDGQYTIFRCDFFLDLNNLPFSHKNNDITTALNFLWEHSQSIGGCGFVRLKEIDIQELETLAKVSEYQSWGINNDEAARLLQHVSAEGNKTYTYHLAGDHSTYSVSTSRSDNHNCASWCQAVLRDVLGIKIGDCWKLVKKPSELVKQAIEKMREEQQTPTSHPRGFTK